MRYLPLLIFIVGCTAREPVELSAAPYTSDSGNLFIKCGALIDGVSESVATETWIAIEAGRIAERTYAGNGIDPSAAILDLSDYTCLPGLINTHVHLATYPEDALDYSVYERRTDADHLRITLENAEITLKTGFTTVRNVGEFFPEPIYAGQELINAGEAVGPRIFAAGPYLTIPGGGGDLITPELPVERIPPAARQGVATTPDEFADRARKAIENGADHLKVIASGAVFSFGSDPGAPEMTEDDIRAVVEVAHAAGLQVTAHVHSAQSGKDAVRAGVDSIEHASLLDDEALRMVADAGVALSMDVYNGTYTDTIGREQGYPENYLRRNYDTTEAQRVVFEKAYAAGITILYGTDAGVLPHTMGGWQFGIMVDRGMSPMDAIFSATSWAADHMNISDDVGAIEVGRYGDLIAVKGNPLDDITVLQDVDVVIKGGLVFKLPPDL
ncbi:MAG: amidohydrolase family protein [Pseudomonadota bacterium]